MELFFILIKWSRYPGYDTVLQFWKMSPLGKLGKEYIESLSIISDNCMWIYNYLKIKGLVKKKRNIIRFWKKIHPCLIFLNKEQKEVIAESIKQMSLPFLQQLATFWSSACSVNSAIQTKHETGDGSRI